MFKHTVKNDCERCEWSIIKIELAFVRCNHAHYNCVPASDILIHADARSCIDSYYDGMQIASFKVY